MRPFEIQYKTTLDHISWVLPVDNTCWDQLCFESRRKNKKYVNVACFCFLVFNAMEDVMLTLVLFIRLCKQNWVMQMQEKITEKGIHSSSMECVVTGYASLLSSVECFLSSFVVTVNKYVSSL